MASHCCRHGRPRTVTIFKKEREILECWALFMLSDPSVSSRLLSLRLFVHVHHTCIGKLLCCMAEATSLIVDLRYDVNALCRQE